MAKDRISVLFDAGPMLDNNKTGIGYYVENVIDSMASNSGSNFELEGYYFNFLGRHKLPYTIPKILLRQINYFPSKLLSLLRRFGVQPSINLLVHGHYTYILYTNYISLPTTASTKTIVFVYDLGFMDCPEFLQDINLRMLKRFCPPSIAKARTVVTISEFTKQRILYHFPDIQAEIIVTPIPPVHLQAKSHPLNARLQKLGVVEGKYFFYLGTIEPRKNVAMLVRAYSQLPARIRSEYALVLAGGKGWKDSEIINEIESAKDNGMNVIQTGYVSDSEKSALYSHALSFVLPSHYEGFGMPILEAMSNDVPVVLSDIPVFHEVAKDAAVYFDKDDVEDISIKLAMVVSDSKLRADLIEGGRRILNEFDSWSENAQKIMDTLRPNIH